MKALVYPSPNFSEDHSICWSCANEHTISTITIQVDELPACELCGKPADGDLYVHRGMCPFCGTTSLVYLNADQEARWHTTWKSGAPGGVHMQVALPDLSPGDRETLINGSHEACFDLAFADPDDD